MRKHLPLSLLLTLSLLMFAGVANADTVHMYFVSGDGNSSFGEYVYPYYVQVDGGSTQNMMCDTLNRTINNGDQWDANRLLLADLNDTNVQSLFYGPLGDGHGTATVQTYLAAAYLYDQEVQAFGNGNTDPQGLYNWAAWDIFDPTDVAGHLDAGTLATVQGLVSAAMAAVAGQQPGDLAFAHTTFIYTPVDGVGQEFFGPVPEPGTLLMLGTGLVGLAGVVRRKLA